MIRIISYNRIEFSPDLYCGKKLTGIRKHGIQTKCQSKISRSKKFVCGLE